MNKCWAFDSLVEEVVNYNFKLLEKQGSWRSFKLESTCELKFYALTFNGDFGCAWHVRMKPLSFSLELNATSTSIRTLPCSSLTLH